MKLYLRRTKTIRITGGGEETLETQTTYFAKATEAKSSAEALATLGPPKKALEQIDEEDACEVRSLVCGATVPPLSAFDVADILNEGRSFATIVEPHFESGGVIGTWRSGAYGNDGKLLPNNAPSVEKTVKKKIG